MDEQIRALAQVIWDYHRLNHQLFRADAILVLCSHDLVVAERGAELFLEGWAPLLIFSGGLGSITSQMWTEPEADRFAAIAVGLGVPKEKILTESKSTNTGENILFTRKLLMDGGIDPRSLILVQKPYMERRAYATCNKLWPEVEIAVASPQMTFDQYLMDHPNRGLSNDDVVSIMVGDLERIRSYPERGFQISQEIPEDVWQAYEALVLAGYDKYLSK